MLHRAQEVQRVPVVRLVLVSHYLRVVPVHLKLQVNLRIQPVRVLLVRQGNLYFLQDLEILMVLEVLLFQDFLLVLNHPEHPFVQLLQWVLEGLVVQQNQPDHLVLGLPCLQVIQVDLLVLRDH